MKSGVDPRRGVTEKILYLSGVLILLMLIRAGSLRAARDLMKEDRVENRAVKSDGLKPNLCKDATNIISQAGRHQPSKQRRSSYV